MWPKLIAGAALATNVAALGVNAGWLTSAMQLHRANEPAAALIGLPLTSLLLLSGPAAVICVLTRHPPLLRR